MKVCHQLERALKSNPLFRRSDSREINRFLQLALHQLKVRIEVLIYALCFLDKLKTTIHIDHIQKGSELRLLSTALLLALKLSTDDRISFRSFASWIAFQPHELRQMEREFLILIDYADIKRPEYEKIEMIVHSY